MVWLLVLYLAAMLALLALATWVVKTVWHRRD